MSMTVKTHPKAGPGAERTVKLYYPNISIYDHESDVSEIAHRLLETGGFILKRPGAARND